MKDSCGICSLYDESLSVHSKEVPSIIENGSPKLSVISEDLELDFDVNPTDLYLSLMRKDWEDAETRCERAPDEAKAWIYRKEDSGKLRWKLLPLHAAVIFGAPLTIVEKLISIHQAALISQDDQGMAPLHLAIRTEAERPILECLIAAEPDTMAITDRKGRTPRDLAAKKEGMLETLDEIVPFVSELPETRQEPVTAELPTDVPALADILAAVNEAPASKPVEDFVTEMTTSPKVVNEPVARSVAPVAQAELLVQEEKKEEETVPMVEYSFESATDDASLLKEKHLQALTVMQGTHDAQVELLKKQHAGALARVQQQSETRLAALQKRLDAKSNLLSKSAASFKTESATRILELEGTVQKLTDQQTALKEERDRLEQMSKSIQEAKEQLESDYGNVKEDHKSQSTSNKAVITNLVSQVGELNTKLEDALQERDQAKEEVAQQKKLTQQTTEKQKNRITELQKECGEARYLQEESEIMRENLQKEVVRLGNKISALEQEVSDNREQRMTAESKLEEVTLSEQELAWKNEALTNTINEMPDPTKTTDHIKALEQERRDLKETVNKLSVKLYKVVGFLDEMAQEQDALLTQSMTRDSADSGDAEDREKLMSNVSGMKEQIAGVIDSVIDGIPSDV